MILQNSFYTDLLHKNHIFYYQCWKELCYICKKRYTYFFRILWCIDQLKRTIYIFGIEILWYFNVTVTFDYFNILIKQKYLFIIKFTDPRMVVSCIRSTNFHSLTHSLTTRGHPLTTCTLALHYSYISPRTTVPIIHCTDNTHSWCTDYTADFHHTPYLSLGLLFSVYHILSWYLLYRAFLSFLILALPSLFSGLMDRV